MHRLDPVKRGRRIGQLARAMVEFALAAADATEIEAENSEAALREHVEKLVDHLIVHRPAKRRMRMEDDRDRAVFPLGGLEAPFEAPGGPGENDFRHVLSTSLS